MGICQVSSDVAAHLPHAVGAAYAARVLGQDRVALAWFGDGAASKGATHEAMNLGSTALPWSSLREQRVGAERAAGPPHAHPRVADRAAAYGMPG